MDFEIEVDSFSLEQTLMSGQFFRFKLENDGWFLVFAQSNFARIMQVQNLLRFKNSTCGPGFWFNFFDLGCDYKKILDGFVGDPILEKAVSFCGHVHILRQDPFETLISFLLSSNNNITRIKNIILTLCNSFGTKFSFGFAFPTISQLKNCSLVDLQVLKSGFRAKYIINAIDKVASGQVDLNKLNDLSTLVAKEKLLSFYGVGSKIADCVLLFAYHRFEVFPVDVWMKRILSEYYVSGLSKQFLSCPGLAQQILYHSKRNGKI